MKHPYLRTALLLLCFSLPSSAILGDILEASLDNTSTPANAAAPAHKPEWLKTADEAVHKGIQDCAAAIEKTIDSTKPHIKGFVEKGLAVAGAAYLLCSDSKQSRFIPATAPKAIVLFIADDLGYNDTAAYGTGIPCPNVQKLADQGLMFTDAHSTNSVCTPSRYSILTGQYAWRQRGTGILPGDAALIIPTRDKAATLGTLMQQAGYRTAAIGKWHLGLGTGGIDWNKPISPAPADIGFDYSFIMAATGDRVPCVYVENGKVRNLAPDDPIQVNYNGKPYPGIPTATTHPELLKPWGRPSDKQHSCTIIDGISRIGHMRGGSAALWKDQDIADDITAAGERFIADCAGKPLFLYFCTNDIHVPRDPHSRFRGKSSLGIRGDVTLQMDDSLGRIMTALEKEGYKPQETLIIFTSDNGPVISDGYEDGARKDCANHKPAHPWRGGKYSLFEGGTRVPFIASWPGIITPGTSSALMCQMDVGRMLATLCGINIPEGSMRDSENHLAALLGQSTTGRTELVTQAFEAPRYALRSGQYKYIPDYGRGRPDRLGRGEQLYDLSTDPGEQKNIAPQQPGKTAELRKLLQELTAGDIYP